MEMANFSIQCKSPSYNLSDELTNSQLYSEDLAPTPSSQRTWTIWNYAALWISMCHCLPTYALCGSLITGGMNWLQALVTIGIGNLIVLIPILLIAQPGTKYGIPFPVLARSAFGTYGANVPAMLRGLVACGWLGINVFLGGEALKTFVIAVWPGYENVGQNFTFLGLSIPSWLTFGLCLLIHIIIIYYGMEAVKKFENWAAPVVLIMAAILLVWLVVKAKGLGSMLKKPSKFQTFHEFWIIFIPSLTSTIGFWSTLALNIPDFTRYGRSQRDQILGQSLGLPLTMLIFSAMAVIITSTAQDVLVNAPGNLWDPVYLLAVITSPDRAFFSTPMRIIIAIVSLLGILIATVSVNIAANVVSPANDFANLCPKYISFKTGGLITCILSVVIMPWKLLSSSEEYVFTWLIGYSALLGPIAGIIIGDYYLLKRRKLEIVELYCDTYPLYSSRAMNWIAMLSLAVGIAPNIPGFIRSLQLDHNREKTAIDQIYIYAWFIGFLLAGFAIRIPHTALLDVFGRPVAINSQDFRRISNPHYSEKNSAHNHHEQNSKGVNSTGLIVKPQNSYRLTVIGETPLHIAIFYNDISSVQLLVKHNVDVNQRVVGDFYPSEHIRSKDETKNGKANGSRQVFHRNATSQKSISLKNANPETTAYYGEYPLAFAAAFGYKEIYDYLIDNGSDPNMQDTYGNTVLHMLVIRDRSEMFNHAIRHPVKKALTDICNNEGLTSLTLAAKLGRKELFLQCLELSHVEIWRYSNIKCCTYPLRGIDTIADGGHIDWNSSLMSIVSGKTENHLDMLDNMLIERLLNDKWSTFARVHFVRQLILLCVHLFFLSTAIFLRNPKDNQLSVKKIFCHIAEVCVLCGCIISIFSLLAKEIYLQGFNSYLQNLKSYPEKLLFQCSCILIILAVPFRILYLATKNIAFGYVEDGLVSLAVPGTFLYFLFFGRIYALTGAFIVMIFEMITGDIATFGVIYVIVITAFGQVFYLLFRDTSEGGNCLQLSPNDTCEVENMCSFKNFEAWMTMVHFTMGEFDFSRFDSTHYSYLVKILFIVFMILTPILLLNMLIASMGNTYQRIITISEKERIRQWAQLVLTIERSCSAKQRFDYQGVYAIGADDKRDIMVIKRVTKSKAAQRKGAISNWKRVGKLVLYLLKEQQTTAEHVRLRRVSHQSVVLKPKAQFDHMLETLAWERDIDLSGPKNLSGSNQNLNLASTQLAPDLISIDSRPSSPPPPQFVTNEYPTPSSIPQRFPANRKPICRSELAELRSRASFVDYEDLEIFHHERPLTTAQQPIRRTSMMPVDADGYKDLLLDFDNKRKKTNQFMSRGTSNTSIKSKTSETTLC
ncbi:unnamed protein product [Rotaria socialis]|uniref:Ion transport domain-containing protein n=1 Tax=Rotaria socialis TaxID=392032 RepID=A0A817V9M6_9BILA|nr:unnamed protein product [Rotaria socialis]